jgi:hypothetical protein
MSDHLLRCLYFERATAHVLLGALPRIPSLDAKLALGRHQHLAMLRASRLEQALAGVDLAVPRAWRDFIAEVDAAAPRVLVRRLCIDVATDLVSAYRAARPVDGPLADVIDAAIREVVRGLRSVRQVLGVSPTEPRRTPAGAETDGSRSIPHDWWLGKPRGRVPHPDRPAKLRPAVLALHGAGATLHAHVDTEIAAMELLARCSYEHPEMPEAFHRDISRQVADEARHAAALAVGAAKLGTPLGTWTMSTDVYDLHYEYASCKPGSQRELLWRLLLRNPLHAPEVAPLVRAITDDEAFHLVAGRKWSRYLCGGDEALVSVERDAASRYIAGDAFTEVAAWGCAHR